jgi:hypothetical protein
MVEVWLRNGEVFALSAHDARQSGRILNILISWSDE